MAFFQTKLAENVFVNLESEVAGGMAKSRGEGKADESITPENGFMNVCKTMGLMAAAMGARLNPMLKQTAGAKLDICFGIKCDPAGNVMVSSFTNTGQFMCTLKLGG